MKCSKNALVQSITLMSLFASSPLQAADSQTNDQELVLPTNKLVISEKYISCRLGVNTLNSPYFRTYVRTLKKQHPNKKFDEAHQALINLQSNKPEDCTISSTLGPTVQLLSICKVVCDFTHSMDQTVVFKQLRKYVAPFEAFITMDSLQKVRKKHFKDVFAQTPIANFSLEEPLPNSEDNVLVQQLNKLSEDELATTVSQVNNNVNQLMQQFEQKQKQKQMLNQLMQQFEQKQKQLLNDKL